MEESFEGVAVEKMLASASINRLFCVALILAFGLLACVMQERRDVSDAQDAYDRCVAKHSESDPECVGLKDHLLSTQRRYDENSRGAWTCDPVHQQCPPAR
jgi:hypothetical protein